MSLNEQVAREVMGWLVADAERSHDWFFDKPEASCIVTKTGILGGIPHRVGLGVEKWAFSWKEWQPDVDIAQAFEVVNEVLSWEWDNDVWFEMTVDGERPIVQLLNRFEIVTQEIGESLPEVICKVAVWAWRKGGVEGRSEDV